MVRFNSIQTYFLVLIAIVCGGWVNLPLSWAASYTETLSLCNLGIQNSHIGRGVDYVLYTQADAVGKIVANASLQSVYPSSKVSEDLWLSRNQISDVSFNLTSDYYGSKYFIEFCYEWQRTAADSVDYEIQLSYLATDLVSVPHTKIDSTITCAAKDKNGNYSGQTFKNLPLTTVLALTSSVAIRCTVRFDYTENFDGSLRQHDLSQFEAPLLHVRVDP